MANAYLKQNALVGGGGGSNKVVASFWGARGATGEGVPDKAVCASCDPDYFTYDSSTKKFTVVQPCMVNIAVFVRGSRTSGGVARDAGFRFFRKTTGSTTAILTGTGTTAGYRYDINSVTLLANDVLYIQIYSVIDGPNTMTAGFSVEVTT